MTATALYHTCNVSDTQLDLPQTSSSLSSFWCCSLHSASDHQTSKHYGETKDCRGQNVENEWGFGEGQQAPCPPARGLWEQCKLLQWGSGQSPDWPQVFHYLWHLGCPPPPCENIACVMLVGALCGNWTHCRKFPSNRCLDNTQSVH